MASNILCAIRALHEPQVLQRYIDDYRLRILSASGEEMKSLSKQLAAAERMQTIKSQFNRYSAFIEHCLVSNLWYVNFVTSGDGSYEDMLYTEGKCNIRIYAVLCSRFKVEKRTPLFFIQLGKESEIEYGLYDVTTFSIINYPIEQIFDTLKFYMDYDKKLMDVLPSYEFKYVGSIPVEVPELGVYQTSSGEHDEPGNEIMHLYYGTSLKNHDTIKRKGIPTDGMLVDSFDTALQIALVEDGGDDRGIIVYEVWVDIQNLNKKIPTINVSSDIGTTIYMLKEGITDTSRMKLKYKTASENAVKTEKSKEANTQKKQQDKRNNVLENQLTFWS